jgi:hypothetical protein
MPAAVRGFRCIAQATVPIGNPGHNKYGELDFKLVNKYFHDDFISTLNIALALMLVNCMLCRHNDNASQYTEPNEILHLVFSLNIERTENFANKYCILRVMCLDFLQKGGLEERR